MKMTYYLAAWFPPLIRTRMLAWFLVGIPLSTVIGGPLAGLLLQLDGIWGLAGWQWLFLGVSLPCVVFGIITYALLTDRPQDAHWLSLAERDALVGMLTAETRERPKSEFWAAVRDPRVLTLAGVQFCFTLGSYGIGIWLPQIVKTYKFSNLEVSLIVTVPYLFASIAMILWAWHIDRTGKKVGNLAIACFLGAVGLVASVLLTGSLLVALAGLTVALIGVTSARAIFWNVPTRFLTGIAAAGGLAFINTIGVFGGFVGPSMMGWLKDLTGSFTTGLLAMAAIMVAATLLAASLKLLIKQE